jgi:GNAT superfamily N-acetyltransferase
VAGEPLRTRLEEEGPVGRRIAQVTPLTLDDLPQPCRGCAFWQTRPGVLGSAGAPAAAEVVKADWVASTVAAWGPCGVIAYVDDCPAGFLLYAPPAFVPRAVSFPTSPVRADAVLLTAGRVLAQFAGVGLGRVLVQSAAKDLTRRGVRAVEAYGDTACRPDGPDGPDGAGSAGPGCLLPTGFLTSVGFVTVREHARHPRLRLDLRTAVSWRDPVEGALERIRGAVRAYPAGANRV